MLTQKKDGRNGIVYFSPMRFVVLSEHHPVLWQAVVIFDGLPYLRSVAHEVSGVRRSPGVLVRFLWGTVVFCVFGKGGSKLVPQIFFVHRQKTSIGIKRLNKE